MSKNLLRIGNGFDSHRFQENRKLILGGLQIPFGKGLAGHSDADVLTHAIIDALLGAANLGDIGELFPSSDDTFKDVSSVLLLREVCTILKRDNWEIINLDCILICEAPKIGPLKNSIRASLAQAIGISETQIGLKGKTAEKMGALGRSEGIAALAIALLEKQAAH